MLRTITNILALGRKELASLAFDPVMLFLIVYAFSLAVYLSATGEGIEIQNASIAIADEDRSQLSQRIHDALREPYFKPPVRIGVHEIEPAMDRGLFTFVFNIPPQFEADVVAGRSPTLHLLVDATAMSQAGRGALYAQRIVWDEIRRFVSAGVPAGSDPVRLAVRAKFNPNLSALWFGGPMEVVNNITLLAILLTGAALIREREHGTLEHLLVLPLRPIEIMIGKIWASGLVIVFSAVLSLLVVVRGVLEVPLTGSIVLFAAGSGIYFYSMAALGILLATIARSMPQFGLLSIPTFTILHMLSGSFTPIDNIPPVLRAVMLFSPSTHFVSFSKAVLFRDASLAMVLPELGAMAVTGATFFFAGLARFRSSVVAAQG